MESHEEKLHKLVLQIKINGNKDVMKHKANEIDKSKIERGKLDKTISPTQSMSLMSSIGKLDGNFSNGIGILSGNSFRPGFGFGLRTDVDSFSSNSKGLLSAVVSAPSKGIGMNLGKSQKANQLLELLIAEGEMIVEDVRPSANPGKSATPPFNDPLSL